MSGEPPRTLEFGPRLRRPLTGQLSSSVWRSPLNRPSSVIKVLWSYVQDEAEPFNSDQTQNYGLQESFAIGPREEVTFTQLTATENTYRDAVRFANELEILLQRNV
jgi:hypothetical protein